METPRPSFGRFIALIFVGIGLAAVWAAFYLLSIRSAPLEPAPTQRDFFSPMSVNYSAPDLTSITDLDGKRTSLRDYRGSVVLVNLWATWCPPCRREMPVLQAFYDKYKTDGFVLVAINQEETRDLVAPFAANNHLTFPIWLDLTYEAERKFGTDSLPSSYVLDRDGRVRLMWVGSVSQENLESHVSPIIHGD